MFVKLIESQEELEQAFAIRMQVFVQEQGVEASVELDEHEPHCQHVLAYYEGKAVGTGRLRLVEGRAKLERICILEDYRSYGLGKIIVQKLEQLAQGLGCHKLKLHGQTHAQGFYESLGYLASPPVFLEENIPHLLFLKEI